MSAPELPDIFGNYALGDFVEIVAPGPVSWWPQTAGWLWVGVFLGLMLARSLWRRWREWHRNRYRREALARLSELGQHGTDANFPGQINELLKLTALAAWSRTRVASLCGQDWVDFLNQNCQPAPFQSPLAELLATGPYATAVLDADTGRRLLAASRTWIVEHRGPADV
jgi:hypothetical protein